MRLSFTEAWQKYNFPMAKFGENVVTLEFSYSEGEHVHSYNHFVGQPGSF